MPDQIRSCERCGRPIFDVFTRKGTKTPVDARPVRFATLRDTDCGTPKIEDSLIGHTSHIETCQNKTASTEGFNT